MEPGQKAERRACARTEIGLDVVCSSGREEGSAILKDLSRSGALLEATTIRTAVGDSVTIWLRTEPDAEPDSLHAEVVRHTSDGFAVEFQAPYSVVDQIVEKYRGDAETDEADGPGDHQNFDHED